MSVQRDFVRRMPSRPLVWLGERERVSDVQPWLGARFPASSIKERDFVLGADARMRGPRDPVG